LCEFRHVEIQVRSPPPRTPCSDGRCRHRYRIRIPEPEPVSEPEPEPEPEPGTGTGTGIGIGTRIRIGVGAGEQTITCARRVGPAGRLLATDIAPRILDHAAAEARRLGLTQIDVRAMDGENIDLPDASFDAVISRVGLIYFPDRARALAGMRRVLKPGGRIAAIVYSTADRNQFFSLPVSIIRRRAGLGPPAPGQPGPFSLGSPGVLEETLRAAGFRDVEARTVEAPLRLGSSADCLRFERESFGALHQMLAGLDAAGQQAAWDEIARELARFDGPNGFEGPCELLVAAGVK
jgi:SAM-dependent methyltransferase